MAEKKQLVLVVESTLYLGSHWPIIFSDYLQKLIRKYCRNEDMKAASSIVELALVQFNAHGSDSTCLVQRSCWTRNVDQFFEWISRMHFSGSGGLCDVAIAEGLTEVLMMCPPPNGTQTQPTEAVQRHCVLVAASNPYPLPTVYWPAFKCEMQSEIRLSDAEAVAKSFPQSCVSLSVISPKQLPKVEAIYNAGKRNPSATAPIIDAKNSNYLILISEDFMEACAVLSPSVRTNSPSNQSPSNIEVTSVSSVSEPPPSSVSPVNEYLPTRQPVSGGHIRFATIKLEPSIDSPSTSRELISSNDNLPYLIVGSGSASLAGASQVAQHARTMMTAPGMSQQVLGTQYVRVNDKNIGTNVGLSRQTSSAPQSRRREYVKIWEGRLDGKRYGQTVMITRLEAYRRSSSADPLAEDWPSTFLIDRLISLDDSKQYAGKREFAVFRALQQHGFLGKMLERKLCAVIKLPSQTLFLSPSPDKPYRLIGMLLSQDIVE